MDLTGKTALVTGGSKGIGYGVAAALVKEGVNVTVTARTQGDVEQAARSLSNMGPGRALGLTCDVRSYADQQRVVEQTVQEFGGLEVLVANDVTVLVDSADRYTPTPAVSHAILTANRGKITGVDGMPAGTGLADGIVVTPSHNPPRDGGFKYNPPNGGPAGTDVTGWVQDRANELLAGGLRDVRRVPYERALRADTTGRFDFLDAYVAALPQVECLSFGIMDFVSSHYGAIPANAMRTPNQFVHPLVVRAKLEIASACHAHAPIAAPSG